MMTLETIGDPMLNPTAVAQQFYDALARSDAAAVADLLTDDFVATLSAGMPNGLGGDHGREDMIANVWRGMAATYEMHVDPADFLPVEDDRVVVLGRYRGTARDGRRVVDADFAHVFTTRGDRVAAL